MRERLLAALRYVLERSQEPTTRIGLVVIITGLIGVEAKSINAEMLGGILALICGTVLAALPSHKL